MNFVLALINHNYSMASFVLFFDRHFFVDIDTEYFAVVFFSSESGSFLWWKFVQKSGQFFPSTKIFLRFSSIFGTNEIT